MSTYTSADHMLSAYVALHGALGCARTMTLPDPKSAIITTSSAVPGESRQARMLCELSEIAVCLKAVAPTAVEWRLLNLIFRPRKRHCLACHLPATDTDDPRCPRCGATTRAGWTFEPYPTLAVLAQHLRIATREPWSIWRVRRLRERVLARIEGEMVRRGLYREETYSALARYV